MERVGDEHEVHLIADMPRKIARIAQDSMEIWLVTACPYRLAEQVGVQVKSPGLAGVDKPAHRRGEVTVAAAQVDSTHASADADRAEDGGRIWPQGLPPVAVRHEGGWEESLVGHLSKSRRVREVG